MDGRTACIFTVEDGQAKFLKTISHVIWPGQTTKQLELSPKVSRNKRVVHLNYGVEVQGKMSKINYHKDMDNVVAKTFYDKQHTLGTLPDGRILIDPDVAFHQCLAIALHARKTIKEGAELYLNYMPDTEGDIDFDAMNHIPEPSLNPEELLALQTALRNIDSDFEASDREQEPSLASDSDTGSGIVQELLSDPIEDETLTPYKQDLPAITDDTPPESPVRKKPSRWFGNGNIQ